MSLIIDYQRREVLLKNILELLYNYWKRVDKLLFIAAAGLGMFGVVMLYSVVTNEASTIELAPRLYKTQAVALVMGAAAALIAAAADYHKILKLWFIYVPVALILFFLTFTDMGITVESTGDRAWLRIGSGSVQPSEILKIAFICTFALHLSKVGDKINDLPHLLLILLHGAFPVVLIVIQGDDGTALVLICIIICMLFSAGISWKYILAGVLAAPVIVYLLWTRFMKPYQKMRFLVLFDEELDPMGYGYHQRYGKIALGSGQVFGKGLISDGIIAIPEAQNDFIFAYVGQTLGFIGCISVIVALVFICLKIFADSRTAKDPEGKYICVGMFSLIFVHSVLNIGMVLGVMPVIGVPLPFLSQGGSSLLSVMAGIGLVLSVYSHSEKKKYMFCDNE